MTKSIPDYMNRPCTLKELEEAINLEDKKSPGPNKVTNEMLKHIDTNAKTKLLALLNNSCKTGMFHRAGKKKTWFSTTRRAKTESGLV